MKKSYWTRFIPFLVIGVCIDILLGLYYNATIFLQDLSYIATVITAGAAWNGLNIWKKQLQGNKDHDIAWKYLEAVLKLRNAINLTVRNPAIFPGESQSALEEFYGKENLESEISKNRNAATLAVYSIRWREVTKARRELDDTIVQAEIWWGEKAVGLESLLNECIGTLFVNLTNYINPDRKLSYDNAIMYHGYSNDSEYDKKLNIAIKKMEDFARPYLRNSE